MAIEKSFQDAAGSQSLRSAINLAGAFTPELFKDSGIDFPRHWGDTEPVPACGKLEVEALSDMGALGDAAQSHSKILQSISKSTQTPSSSSVLPWSEQRHPLDSLNEVSRRPAKNRRIGPSASVPKSMELNRRQWPKFTRKRHLEGPTSNITPATVALREARLILTHPLTDLTKAVQQTLSASFYPKQVASPISASSAKQYHSLDTLASPWPYNSENAAIVQTVNCAIMEAVNPSQSSATTVNGSYSPAGKGVEADEQGEPSLQKDIPEIALNPQPEGSKDQSTQTSGPEKIPMRNKSRKYKIALLTTGGRLVVKVPINVLNSTMFEGHANGKSTVELALEMLRETGYVHSETMLNYGSSGVEKYPRVVINNNENTDALRKRQNNNIKTSTENSPEISPDTSSTLIHESEELTKRRLDLQKGSEMDLNRDLPPLPLATGSRSLQLGEQSQQHSLDSVPDCTLELLQPLYYDPVRDSLKYGGIHYHPDGMRYYPEVLQHPPRTSSMPRPGTPLDTPSGTMHHQVKAGERPKPSLAAHAPAEDVLGPTHASDASYSSEASAGIMGNFIPVRTVASSSGIVTRAVHVPRIETNCDMWMTGHNSKPNTTCGKVPSHVLTYSKKGSEKIDGFKVKDSDSVNVKQDLGGPIVPNNDHDSIDLNDPEALAKYIQHLKKIKQPTEIKKQSGPNSSLSQSSDGEAGKFVGNNDTDDCTVVDSDEDAEAPQFIAQDYSEILAGNPFEFELDDIQNDPERLTTFADFMGGTNKAYEKSNPLQSRKLGHLKNSHSESNALYMKRRPEPIQVVESNTPREVLNRSDSSPNMSPTRIAARRDAAQGSLQSFYEEDERSCSRTVNRSQYVKDLSRSPTRGHGFSRSSPIQLDDVPESQEITFETPSPSQKRPWSPVKKIFGEGGWLSSTASSKEESTTPKKPGLVEKIKLKIEEIGLKADLSPIKYPFRSDHEKSWEHSTFPISLNPAQQAEL